MTCGAGRCSNVVTEIARIRSRWHGRGILRNVGQGVAACVTPVAIPRIRVATMMVRAVLPDLDGTIHDGPAALLETYDASLLARPASAH